MNIKSIVVSLLLFYLLCCSMQAESKPILPEKPTICLAWHGNVAISLNTQDSSVGHELLWTANTTGTNYEESAVIVVDGIAYIGSCSTHGAGHDKLFAIDVATGDILWSNDTGPGYVGPTVDGDTVYFGSCTHGHDPTHEYLFAFDRFTGQRRWKVPIYGGIAETIQVDSENLYFLLLNRSCDDLLRQQDQWEHPVDVSHRVSRLPEQADAQGWGSIRCVL